MEVRLLLGAKAWAGWGVPWILDSEAPASCYTPSMRVLIIYATNSGGTQQVADLVAEVFRRAGHTVTLKRAYEPGADDFEPHDLVVLGSCTWERFENKKRLDGQLQQHMHDLVTAMAGQSLPEKKFAVFGLGDSGFTHFCAAADHLEKFVADLGGKLIAPTMRLDRFFFDLDRHRAQARAWAESLIGAQPAPAFGKLV